MRSAGSGVGAQAVGLTWHTKLGGIRVHVFCGCDVWQGGLRDLDE